MGFWKEVKHEWAIPFIGTKSEKLNFCKEVIVAVIFIVTIGIMKGYSWWVQLLTAFIAAFAINRLYLLAFKLIYRRHDTGADNK